MHDLTFFFCLHARFDLFLLFICSAYCFVCLFACVYAFVRACMCFCVCVRACVSVCVRDSCLSLVS